MPRVFEDLGVPAPVAAGLAKLRDDLQKVAGDNLVSMALYGGLARKRYYPGRSDINLLLILREANIPELQRIAPLLHQAWRSFLVEPLLVGERELEFAARDFPAKFLDIQNHHIHLAGREMLKSFAIPNEYLRDRTEQELRNRKMRLRRRFLASAENPGELTRILQNLARPLAVELATLLHLQGHPIPEDYNTASIFQKAAQAFDLDGKALAELASLRAEARPPENATQLYGQTLGIIDRALSLLKQGQA